jgi:hypothetical protein
VAAQKVLWGHDANHHITRAAERSSAMPLKVAIIAVNTLTGRLTGGFDSEEVACFRR